ncbi:MAG: hypothetical protein RR728_06020, partial [Oscillospiraceae bacterium]
YYAVTYLLNGATYAIETYQPGTPISLLGIPALAAGQVFSGWSALPGTMPEGNVTVTGTITTPTTTLPDEEVPEGPAPSVSPSPSATPEALVTLPDENVPQGPAPTNSGWALVNLLAAIATVLTSIVLLAGYYIGKKKNEQDGTEEQEETLKRKGVARLMSLVPAIGSIIMFIITENMQSPMVMVDKWTAIMLCTALVQLVVCILCKKTDKKEDENQGGANA